MDAGRLSSQLERIERRFEELTQQLSDPALLGDAKRVAELGKERAGLEPVVELARNLRQVDSDLAGARELVASDDPQLREMAKMEVRELEERKQALSGDLQVALLPKDPMDDKGVVLEIRAGTGGDEAALFAGELFQVYQRYAASRGWKVDVVSSSPGSAGGFKEVVASIEGEAVYGHLKFEAGTHRVQRVPATESQGRIHTSAVTVAVMPEAEEVDVQIQPGDLRIDVFRAGGHGGQSVNTTDSAVRIVHLPTQTTVICQDEKSQHKNKAKAMKVLMARLYDMETERALKEQGDLRKSMVGSGDRSEKIRTYNFPQDRVSDHRINLTVHNLPKIMQGEIHDIVQALRNHARAEQLKGA